MISAPPEPDLKNQTRKPIANTTPSINGASNVCVLPPTSYPTKLIHHCGPFPQRNVAWRQQAEQPLPNPHLVAGPLSSATPVILSTLWWGVWGFRRASLLGARLYFRKRPRPDEATPKRVSESRQMRNMLHHPPQHARREHKQYVSVACCIT